MNKLFYVILSAALYFVYGNDIHARNWGEVSGYFGEYYSSVDSILIYLIDYDAVGCGRMVYRRDKIEEIYDYYKDNPKTTTSKIVLKSKGEILMFMTMLKNMTPLDSTDVKIKPNEIIDTRENWLSPYGFDLNDPLEVRGKIIIYNDNGNKEEGYVESRTFIDIFDWRYKSEDVQQVLRGFHYNYDPESNGLL